MLKSDNLLLDKLILTKNLLKSFFNVFRGLDNAGKTTFLKKLIGQDVDTISPTLGFSISTIDYKKSVSLGLIFFVR